MNEYPEISDRIKPEPVIRMGQNTKSGLISLFLPLLLECRTSSSGRLASDFKAYRFLGMESDAHLHALDRAVQQTRAGLYLKAIERFEAALESGMADLTEAKRQGLMSYYGLCVAMVWGRTAQPLAWCRAAVSDGQAHADLYHNLAMVLLRAGRRLEAIQALEKGARVDPDHGGIQATFQRLTRRRRPPIPFLGRRHFLNRSLGLLLHRASGQN